MRAGWAFLRLRISSAQEARTGLSIMGSMSTPVTAASERGQLRPTTAPLHHADGSPIRILVVDDEHTLTDLLQMALRYEGWEVKSAANGQQALTVAREFKPDAVVLDIMLPDIDGLQVMARMREGGGETPVLFLTAKDSLDDRITGLTAGGDDYVTKPFSLEELLARLRGLLRRAGAQGSGPGLSGGAQERAPQ